MSHAWVLGLGPMSQKQNNSRDLGTRHLMSSALVTARGYAEGAIIALYVAGKQIFQSLSTTLARHPLGLLFLLLWLTFTWPMTITVIMGSFGLLGAAILVSTGALFMVAPLIIALSALAFMVWLCLIPLYVPYASYVRPKHVPLENEWPPVAAQSSPRSRPATSVPTEPVSPPSPISI